MTHPASSPVSRVGIRAGALLLCIVASAAPARATSGQNGLHDPSRMLASNGKVYVYSTEGGSISSADGLVWSSTTRPPWNPGLLPNNDGVWAPDGIFYNGQYYLYYAMWSDGTKSSAVALLTTPSLDPSSAKWSDRGVAVSGPKGVTHSVIDPCPVLDASGNLWVTWGGGYPFNSASNSIFVTRMDNTTGLPLTSDPGWKPPDSPGYAIETGHKEGSYLYYHSGYYYLFWQTGNGFDPNTGYAINMARATAITGPYSGDRIFYSKNPAPGIYGPGHMGIYSCGNVERFTYHFYANETNSGSALGENALTWGSDGWPVPGAVSSTPLMPCVQMAGSGGSGGTDSGGSPGTAGTPGSGGDGNSGGVSGDTGGTPGSSGTEAGGSGTSVAGAGSPGSGGDGAGMTNTSGAPAFAGGSSEPPSNSNSGCSCRVESSNARHNTAGLFAVFGVAMVTARRTRRRRQRA